MKDAASIRKFEAAYPVQTSWQKSRYWLFGWSAKTWQKQHFL